MTDIAILKAVGQTLLEPSRLISVLLIGGLVLLIWKKHRKKSMFVFASALTLYVIFGTGPVAFWLLGSLEFRYSPYMETEGSGDVEDIVLLTGYAERDSDKPLSSYVNDSSAIRILEAARIFRLNPGRRIIVSGKDDVPIMMKDVLVSLGIPEERIGIEGHSNSTIGSGLNLSTLLKGKKIILVTSAGHMYRSFRVFNNFGMHPIPAPTDFMTKRNFLATGYLPSPRYLKLSDLAVHEYIGILWYGGKEAKKTPL
jgi:uncharacterized SAM-binding protein YcdF (DUF218 family)